MPRLIIVVISILLATASHAGQKAITDTGDEVILHSDGTWKFVNNSRKTTEKITTNQMEFTKPDSSFFLLKSTRNTSAFWINPAKWSFEKASTNAEAEYEFQLKGQDLYGMVIAEGVQMPVESLTDIAVTIAKNAVPDIEVTKKEYRYVNGNKVIYMEMRGTMQGMKVTYLGHYYTDAAGSTQLVAYTGTALADKYRSEISDFLNGLAVQ